MEDDLVIVAAEYDGRDSGLYALDIRSGKQVWKIARPSNLNFASPIVATIAGQRQLLLAGADTIVAYDPIKGRVPLWKADVGTEAICGTVVWDGRRIIFSGGNPEAGTWCVNGDGSAASLWENGVMCYEQSLLAIKNFVFAVADNGVAYCWRTVDGNETWKKRLLAVRSAPRPCWSATASTSPRSRERSTSSPPCPIDLICLPRTPVATRSLPVRSRSTTASTSAPAWAPVTNARSTWSPSVALRHAQWRRRAAPLSGAVERGGKDCAKVWLDHDCLPLRLLRKRQQSACSERSRRLTRRRSWVPWAAFASTPSIPFARSLQCIERCTATSSVFHWVPPDFVCGTATSQEAVVEPAVVGSAVVGSGPEVAVERAPGTDRQTDSDPRRPDAGDAVGRDGRADGHMGSLGKRSNQVQHLGRAFATD